MASVVPLRLLSYNNGHFEVKDTRHIGYGVDYSIITYTWGAPTTPYDCKIDGVTWELTISPQKLDDIKRLMIEDNIQLLWVDCVCINQTDSREKLIELPKMYDYYKCAYKCYVLMDMIEVWDPQTIVDNLQFVNHVLTHMGGAALASEAMLPPSLVQRLDMWAKADWNFGMSSSTVRAAAIDLGVINCYSTCINRIRSLFSNDYFSRVWTFQEILLGKNITMYGINGKNISCIGELGTWMDLATDARDKAVKLLAWIVASRVHRTASINAVLGEIEDDYIILDALQKQVTGISSARMDIINGGPYWWYENHKGISNIFSAISLRPRKCKERKDLFIGLLGIFNGLFTQAEIDSEMNSDNIEKSSFAFFKQLSTKTGHAWTTLAISSKERGECDWIPSVSNSSQTMTTDCFAGVVNLGRLKPKGIAKSLACTGILGNPQKYMRISINQGGPGFYFTYRGCNAGKKMKTGLFKSEAIPTQDHPINVAGDETGRILVQCATILGSIMDPHNNIIDYRRRFLSNLQPHWRVTDPNAKPSGWKDRCVSGTSWENPHPWALRVHNWSMNYRFASIYDCGSRLHNESTENMSCEVRVACGCTIVAPFSLIFEAITSVHGSSLGGSSAEIIEGRIISKDGLGLVQVGDIGRSFSLVAFGGDPYSHTSYASACRGTKQDRIVEPKMPWPRGRALVRDEFTHGMTDSLRDYGYVQTGGSGNLLVCRNNPVGQYKIIGVCIDEFIDNKKGQNWVNIR
ncbi:hypothetical protein GLAREA_12852 [Glarea lozoyensis ATCC 20868]|uniref:Heterokaryon incompatibility domain-containing protein n=1 Tax=Glarea lozoyensis (strain ATCC 20868 / MF5171) TaxID=1116229 RepID=S3CYV8_GLAL2|nr:uncharacterized protein GLAREA_12852 [Glarea lozoyensis ATCC 20868]EPE30129.1 hypothetical protein GLAREA_12852 [Glarea lozoyensis ATCC 20868]